MFEFAFSFSLSLSLNLTFLINMNKTFDDEATDLIWFEMTRVSFFSLSSSFLFLFFKPDALRIELYWVVEVIYIYIYYKWLIIEIAIELQIKSAHFLFFSGKQIMGNMHCAIILNHSLHHRDDEFIMNYWALYKKLYVHICVCVCDTLFSQVH